MDARSFSAVFTPSFLFVGFAMHELATSLFFMMTNPSRWKTLLFRFAALAWFAAAGQTLTVLVLLDFNVSPYTAPAGFNSILSIIGFGFNFLAFLGTAIIMLYRLRVFYTGRSPVFWSIFAIAIICICIEISANALGIMTNLQIVNGQLTKFRSAPLVALSSMLFAAARILESIFSVSATFTFLWSIGSSLGLSSKALVREIIFKHEGMRFIAIVGLNVIISIFAIHACFYGFNFITFTSFFLPPWIYALEIHAFLLTSYVTTRSLIDEHTGNRLSSGKQAGHAKNHSHPPSQDINCVDNIKTPPPSIENLPTSDNAFIVDMTLPSQESPYTQVRPEQPGPSQTDIEDGHAQSNRVQSQI